MNTKTKMTRWRSLLVCLGLVGHVANPVRARGGGERSQSAEALEVILRELSARGFKFYTRSALGSNRWSSI